jgi:hypothetical protein
MRIKLSLSHGAVTAIYSDDLADLAGKASRVEIRRASAVEPAPDGGWAATMNDGTVLGPYKLRAEALAEEVKYLEAKLF